MFGKHLAYPCLPFLVVGSLGLISVASFFQELLDFLNVFSTLPKDVEGSEGMNKWPRENGTICPLALSFGAQIHHFFCERGNHALVIVL